MKKIFRLQGIWVDKADVIAAGKALGQKKINYKLPWQGLHFDPLTAIVVFFVTMVVVAILAA